MEKQKYWAASDGKNSLVRIIFMMRMLQEFTMSNTHILKMVFRQEYPITHYCRVI